MNGQEAGVTSPSGNIKYFISYFIVFAVAAVIIVSHSESRNSNPVEKIASAVKSAPRISVLRGDDASSADRDFVFELLFTDFEDCDSDDMSLVVDLEEDADFSMIEGPGTLYYPIILEASRRYQVDPLLVRAMIEVESGFNPNAVSHVGAQGLMQLMPSTAKALGVKDSFNPEHNIDGGVKYMKKLLDRFNGDIRLALAAYNAGSRKVRKYRGVPPFSETKNYIEKVFKLHTDYKKSESETVKRVFLSQS